MSQSLLVVLFVVNFCLTGAVDLSVEGLCPAVYTPFDDDGNLNVSIIPIYAKYLENNRINGVLVAGTSGEGPALSLDERKQLLNAWIREGKKHDLKVVMQVGGQPMPQVLEMAQYSESAGADAIMTLPELYFNKPVSESSIVRYMEFVSNAAPKLPILYYHHPSMSGVNINVAKFFEEAVATVPNFKGMKCDLLSVLGVAATGKLRDDQELFINTHLTVASGFFMGFNSSMTAAISIYPKLFVGIEDAVRSGNIEKARSLQLELNTRMAVISSRGQYVSFGKAAMEILTGIRVGNTRDPLKLVSEDQKKELEAAMREVDAKYKSPPPPPPPPVLEE